jgi:hypothetical protein
MVGVYTPELKEQTRTSEVPCDIMFPAKSCNATGA